MGKVKEDRFGENVRFSSEQSEYVFQLKKKRSWWWLLWFLLLLLLFIPFEHDLTVTCLDERTNAPQANIEIEVTYDSHYLYKNGEFFVTEHYAPKTLTDAGGNAVFPKVGTSVYSYIFYCMSKVTATADDIVSVSKLLHFTRHIYLYLDDIDCDIDIVMCIDNTGSMDKLQNMVKSNAMNFCEDLSKYCNAHHRNVKSTRMKVISFGDLVEKPIESSPFYVIPDQKADFQTFVNAITADQGGDDDESGLEALAMAMKSDWKVSEKRLRHIIVVYTDAGVHHLEDKVGDARYYPTDIPNSFKELSRLWLGMNHEARKLVLFAPNTGAWEKIGEDWPDVSHQTESLSTVLSGSGYDKVLEAICKSL